MAREFTGRKVAIFTVSAFALIIGVNIYMATKAISTFPGLEVENSYVASQTFDADRTAQLALGWTLVHDYSDGVLKLTFVDADGRPAPVDRLTATVGRVTEAADDKTPEFAYDGQSFVAPVELGRGKWMIMLQAYAKDGTLFQQRLDMKVKG